VNAGQRAVVIDETSLESYRIRERYSSFLLSTGWLLTSEACVIISDVRARSVLCRMANRLDSEERRLWKGPR
jgi:hypothetical protein